MTDEFDKDLEKDAIFDIEPTDDIEDVIEETDVETDEEETLAFYQADNESNEEYSY